MVLYPDGKNSNRIEDPSDFKQPEYKGFSDSLQHMDIERYYAAFPALEKAVPACLKKSSEQLLTSAPGSKPSEQLLTSTPGSKPSEQLLTSTPGSKPSKQLLTSTPGSKPSSLPYPLPSNEGPLSTSSRISTRSQISTYCLPTCHTDYQTKCRQPPVNHLHRKSKSSCIQYDNDKKEVRFDVKSSKKANYEHRKPKKPVKEQKKKIKSGKTRGWKPWKALPDVECGTLAATKCNEHDLQSQSARPSAQDSWSTLNDFDLENILNEPMLDINSMENLRRIWNPPDVECKDTVLDRRESHGAGDIEHEEVNILEHHKTWLSSYEELEEQISKIPFCESLTSEASGSRLMPLFHDKQLAYVLENLTLDEHILTSQSSSRMFTCKHCEESYEIVLNSEMKLSKPLPHSTLLDHIDSRLDFDWTKYHPPPWLYTPDADAESSRGCDSPPSSCDCEFCRSRIWKRSCDWCGTPI